MTSDGLTGKTSALSTKCNISSGGPPRNIGRIVTIGPLLLFSTESGDAWILDPADHLATRIAEGGDPRPVQIEETEMSVAVGWQGRYEIVGPAFVFTDQESGRIAATLGYPIREIADRIAAVWVSGGS